MLLGPRSGSRADRSRRGVIKSGDTGVSLQVLLRTRRRSMSPGFKLKPIFFNSVYRRLQPVISYTTARRTDTMQGVEIRLAGTTLRHAFLLHIQDRLVQVSLRVAECAGYGERARNVRCVLVLLAPRVNEDHLRS